MSYLVLCLTEWDNVTVAKETMKLPNSCPMLKASITAVRISSGVAIPLHSDKLLSDVGIEMTYLRGIYPWFARVLRAAVGRELRSCHFGHSSKHLRQGPR